MNAFGEGSLQLVFPGRFVAQRYEGCTRKAVSLLPIWDFVFVDAMFDG